MLNMRLAKPAMLIDIMRVREPRRIASDESNAIVIPAGVRHRQPSLVPRLRDEVPLLAAALPWVGHFQTRARGTVCGSVAHADPSAEIPLCLVALGGEIRLRSKRKSRGVTAEAFFTGMMADGKRRRRDDRSGRVSEAPRPARATPSPKSAGGMAISRSSPARRSWTRNACASPSAASRTARPRAISRLLDGARSTTR